MDKEYLVMVDMDGTLFDTTEVNFCAYHKALEEINVELNRRFYREECFGKHYKVFLGEILNQNTMLIEQVHERKRDLYSGYMHKARKNTMLVMMLERMKPTCNVVLVTTASKRNAEQILSYFNMENFFDGMIAQEDVGAVKPDPECYKRAIGLYNVEPENSIIFEDSDTGVQAAEKVTRNVMRVEGF